MALWCAPIIRLLILKSYPDSCFGRIRLGLTTKIHALTDNDGLPVTFVITPGQNHDI